MRNRTPCVRNSRLNRLWNLKFREEEEEEEFLKIATILIHKFYRKLKRKIMEDLFKTYFFPLFKKKRKNIRNYSRYKLF